VHTDDRRDTSAGVRHRDEYWTITREGSQQRTVPVAIRAGANELEIKPDQLGLVRVKDIEQAGVVGT
jgi:hypothetical protein